MTSVIFRILAILALTLIPVQPASALYVDGGDIAKPQYDPTRLIVKLHDSVDPQPVAKSQGVPQIGISDFDNLNLRFQVVDQTLLFNKVSHAESNRYLKNVFVISVGDGADILEMKSASENLGSVEYAIPDYYVIPESASKY